MDEPLFSGVSLGIDEGARIGLIGRNGAGKSTFLHLITGTLEPDAGTIARNRMLRISMLEQMPSAPANITIREYLYHDTSYRVRILNDYRQCLSDYEHDHSQEHRLAELTDKMDKEGVWGIEHEYLSRLTELGLEDPDLPMDQLSGGMIKKSAIARALASGPNMLILDEPTNHLDIDTIEWLESYLKNNTLGFIMVTHDRYFLDAVCTTIFELDDRTIYTYEGNYTTFLERRAQRLLEQQRHQEKIANILRREREWLMRGPKARTSKDKLRIQRVQDLMDSQVQLEHESAEFTSSHRRLGKKILELKGIAKSYGDTTIISPFSYSFKRGERIGIVGPNGSGKTTFLDLISGRTDPTEGTMDVGINTVFGYYDQLSTPLKETMTVLEYMEDISELIVLGHGAKISAARFLEMFNFPVSMHRVEISRLSGGERRRLYLISVLLRNPNFLIIDEPTNDLDIDTMRRLEEYLDNFSGCVLAVSHDRAFLDRVTDYLFVFDGTGRITGIAGNYSDYRTYLTSVKSEQDLPVDETSARKVKQVRHNKKGLSFKEQREYEQILQRIEELEQEKKRLEEDFCNPEVDPAAIQKLHLRYQEIDRLLTASMERWEYLSEISGE